MKNTQLTVKGLNIDLNEEFQPDNTYRFLLNGVFESLIGERGGVINERGNKPIIGFPTNISNYAIVGDCLLPNQDKVLFITNDEVQIIALHKKNNTYKELIRTDCLEFQKCDQVDCKFKVHNGCDIIIYFTDHKSKYKSIDLTSVEEQTGRYEVDNHIPAGTVFTGDNPANYPDASGNYGWNCNEFYLSLYSKHPNILYNSQGTNGSLRTGTYTFFVRLLDEDFNPTDWLTWSNPITVKQGTFNHDSVPDNTDGIYVPDANTETFVSKSITLLIDELDSSFDYYEVAVVERSINLNAINYSYRTGPKLIPTSGSDLFIFNSATGSSYVNVPLASLLTRTRKIDVVQAHAQINNRLIVGNVKGTVRDWSKFQRKANNIKLEYFTYSKVDYNDPKCDDDKEYYISSGKQALNKAISLSQVSNDAIGTNYSDPLFLSFGMSLMRDEVYALGIIYVFNDGSESPVFHIPGRPKFSNTPTSYEVSNYLIDGFDYADYANNHLKTLSLGVNNAPPYLFFEPFSFGNQSIDSDPLTYEPHETFTGSWISDSLTNLPQGRGLIVDLELDDYKYNYGYHDRVSCCYQLPVSNSSCGNTFERWNYYNTAIRRKSTLSWSSPDDSPVLSGNNPYFTFSLGYRGVPGYYDTGLNYPDLIDCDGNRVFPEGPVRHHKLPDHRIEELYEYWNNVDIPFFNSFGHDNATDWYNSSTTDVSSNLTEYANWQMNDSEGSLKLFPLGIMLHNVAPPEEFRDEVVGYYIVRSDRSNNKTVVDKGFINVSDTTVSEEEWPSGNLTLGSKAIENSLTENEIYPNYIFLTPSIKNNSDNINFATTAIPSPLEVRTGTKLPINAWWNILEIKTPKSQYNNPVVLSADYIKLEATVFGDMFFDRNLNGGGLSLPPAGSTYVDQLAGLSGNIGWNTGISVFLNRHKYPRVQSRYTKDEWNFVYNIPLSGLQYAGYNSKPSTNSLGVPLVIDNANYQQRTLVGKYEQKCTEVAPQFTNGLPSVLNIGNRGVPNQINDSICDLSFPYSYDAIKRDILQDELNVLFVRPPLSMQKSLKDLMLGSDANNGYADFRSWSTNTNATSNYKFSVPHSPYMYYAALKSSITPYEDFSSINYIKMHSYMIPSGTSSGDVDSFAITGGDTFINRFQFEKGYWRPLGDNTIGTADNAFNQNTEFVTTLTAGYVESEINSQFTHLQEGDLFRTFPYSRREDYFNFLGAANVIGGTTREDIDNFMEQQEIVYRYKLDYSSYNAEIQSFALDESYNYCSQCSESFPNTLYYSEVSLDSQSEDFYKIFLTNSEKAIPNHSGEITNMFVKNSDLYVHTEHNLWKLSVAPQEIKTDSATISVGQGDFLNREPIKLFNNDDGFSRGGCIDKFTSRFCSGQFIWLDRNSNAIFSLGEGINIISDIGMRRWFSNNSELEFNTQYQKLTGKDYPLLGTSCINSVGYKSIFDPEHDRYIITKKDYYALNDLINNIFEVKIDPNNVDEYLPSIQTGVYYFDDEGVYVGIGNGNQVSDKESLLERLDFTDKTLFENKSWTTSFSLKDNVWSSWHSYIPNWTYNDSYTFYSFITNESGVFIEPDMPLPPGAQPQGTSISNYAWEHNYGRFQEYYQKKFDFIIDYPYKKQGFTDKSFDTIEYTSNVWLESAIDKKWIEIPFVTFDKFYVYNNTQINNKKNITVSNENSYYNIQYDVNDASAHKWRDNWRINRLRDQSDNRSLLVLSKHSVDWNQPEYQDEFDNGFGYIDKIINPNIINLNKPVYKLQRFTEKFLNNRLFFKPDENYKISVKILTGEKRNRI